MAHINLLLVSFPKGLVLLELDSSLYIRLFVYSPMWDLVCYITNKTNTITSFQDVGRFLSIHEPLASLDLLTTTPLPSVSQMIDPKIAKTSIQLRLEEITNIVSRSNTNSSLWDVLLNHQEGLHLQLCSHQENSNIFQVLRSIL